MSVLPGQRFTQANRCPICSGHPYLPKGQGRRCWGFQNGDWAICTREEMSGSLPDNGSSGYSHLLTGKCRCGNDHDGWSPPTVRDQNGPANTQDTSLYAGRLWDEAVEARGTGVETYLKGRGITAPVPPALRFHPYIKHTASGKAFPGMVAAVMRCPSTDVVAIHRTYLLPDGSGKADVDPNKMSLGPIAGGAVRLGSPAAKMAISEGIEDGMTLLQETGMSVWAATSASAMRSIVLPELPMAAEVVICADPDPDGQRAAAAAAERWAYEGRVVRVAIPPVGKDFNDVHRGGFHGARNH